MKKQIDDYARGKILGQSFLLAGHRGSGKTTFAHLAVQVVAREVEALIVQPTASAWMRPFRELFPRLKSFMRASASSRDSNLPDTDQAEGEYRAIPFLVPLHGPDLLPDLRNSGPAGRRSSRAHPWELMPEFGEEALVRSALHHITRSFHRALCREFAKRFAQAVDDTYDAELAADLAVQLDQAPDLQRLRGYWDRIGRLERGVVPMCPANRSGQGYRELVAIYTAILAAQKCTSREEEATPSHVHLVEPPPGVRNNKGVPMDQAVRLAAPVLSLLAGAFAANSVADTLGAPSTGAVAIATVLLAYSFLIGAGRSLGDHTLAVDASIQTLDLMLPVMVERSLDAGLAPIFVVDELDKVSGFESQIEVLIRKLKYFVTDRAMFCFLADRGYYEQLRVRLERNPYRVESTYYADKLLIFLKPKDISTYIAANRADRAALNDTPTPAEAGAVIEKDWNLWLPGFTELLFVFQSRCHLAELQRLFDLHCDKRGELILPNNQAENVFNKPAYHLAALFQLAIERTLDYCDVHLRQEPAVTLWLIDALYGVARRWERGPAVELERDSFIAELERNATGNEAFVDKPTNLLSPVLRSQLWKSVKMLIEYLARPQMLGIEKASGEEQSTATDRKLRTHLVENSHPLVIVLDSELHKIRFEWAFDEFGEPRIGLLHTEEWADSIRNKQWKKAKNPEIAAVEKLIEACGANGKAQWSAFNREEWKHLPSAFSAAYLLQRLSTVGGTLNELLNNCKQHGPGEEWVTQKLPHLPEEKQRSLCAFLAKEPVSYVELWEHLNTGTWR
ncbi:MAG: hypothetical protein JNK87_00640 [Bryobacterales bacterium]|nr:hypothetical protein [Bryobacterales bacterium]